MARPTVNHNARSRLWLVLGIAAAAAAAGVVGCVVVVYVVLHRANFDMNPANNACTRLSAMREGDGPALRWCAKAGRFVVADPVVGDGLALVVGRSDPWNSAEAEVGAFEATTGAERWRFRAAATDGNVVGKPAVGGGLVYLVVAKADPYQTKADGPGVLLALDAGTGTERWRAATGGATHRVPASPIVVGDLVVVIGGDRVVRAFDTATGAARWSVAIPDPGVAPIFLSVSPDGRLYVVADRLHDIDPVLGVRRWTTAPLRAPAGPAARLGPLVYVADADHVVAFDVETGAERWRASTGAVTGLAVSQSGTVYVGIKEDGHAAGGTGALVALDGVSGAERWREEVGHVARDPVVVGDTVYVAAGRRIEPVVGYLVGLDAESGRKRWELRIGKVGYDWPGPTAAVAGSGWLYVGSGYDEHLLAVAL